MLTGRIAEDFRLPRQEPVGKQLLFCRFKADTADGCREALPSIPFSRNSRIAFFHDTERFFLIGKNFFQRFPCAVVFPQRPPI